ncbi:hypothetical protein BLL42_28095 (plasmid) [Pseudomonas frederiksbergensis]|uniref:Uncharacterized protein n=1 Tax=Pseudomonas frederiksbergensis TaxID=104087 RepID=A0A1J0EU02_9PSED|nr:hypothetical protein BLL42_28095 [Pseudomonas frederiksbergensis]
MYAVISLRPGRLVGYGSRLPEVRGIATAAMMTRDATVVTDIRPKVHHAMRYLGKDTQHLRLKPMGAKCMRKGTLRRLSV